MAMPADSHVHSEFSWDTVLGSMERSCERAVAIGLPAIVFTEHVDHTRWTVPTTGPYASKELTAAADPDGLITPPAFDAPGYLETIDRCRTRFPELRILTGLEVGEPHWHAAQCADILTTGTFDRVLGSLHCLPDGDGFAEPWALFPHRDPADLVREYLTEIPKMVATDAPFTVLAHIDYPLRFWPADRAGAFAPESFEDHFRHALRATAASGRALEINTRIPWTRRFSAGGTRRAAKPSASAATPTAPNWWPTASRKPPPWPRHTASARAAIPTTYGQDQTNPHFVRSRPRTSTPAPSRG
ncbi:hypothetical protein Aiant_02160 [Actinoplanes ianthinogenes]|uniref:Histidinol-phosphatase n=1 Tax=Actinoplanes ianthinogenes TaxID=122358 RepID=A0ABM7LJW8_9ACTN|nr:PHP domain-containing protein [Actinoplanes ianthinogenes]BCJ39559.1 hypothetical protein Aiant_02160 [Actinoplanes ianthinogenes]